MKKLLSVLFLLIFFGNGITTYASAYGSATPYLNNSSNTRSEFTIDDNGNAEVVVRYWGIQGVTTGATITTKIQKRFLLVFWNDVDIGTPNNEWIDESTAVSYSNVHSVSVPKGNYRVKIKYVIRGTNGSDDVIEETLEAKY